MDCYLSPLFKNLSSSCTFAVLSCEPVAISLSLGEIVTELMPCIKRWTKLSTQDTARHSTKLITLYWQKFLTLSPDRSKSFYTQQEQQYVKWVKKNYPKLVIKVIYVNLRPARKYQERTPLLFFTTTYNNGNSFSLVLPTLLLHKARSNQCQHLNNYAPSPPRSYPTTVN